MSGRVQAEGSCVFGEALVSALGTLAEFHRLDGDTLTVTNPPYPPPPSPPGSAFCGGLISSFHQL